MSVYLYLQKSLDDEAKIVPGNIFIGILSTYEWYRYGTHRLSDGFDWFDLHIFIIMTGCEIGWVDISLVPQSSFW